MTQTFSILAVSPGERNRSFTVETSNSMLVRALHGSIAQKFGLNSANIRLSYLNAAMDENKTVAFYALQKKSKIFVAICLERATRVVVVGTTGESTTQKVFPGDTVKKFLERYQRKHKISAQLVIMYDGEDLEDEKKLDELGLEDHSTLNLHQKLLGGD